jgi:N-acetylglucosaminyl-diphospho-decaprenol L-rhamnosyltransferase
VSVAASVVVVTYRCRDVARACLASLYEGTGGVSFEVIVVDNASGDGTEQMVREEFPQARLFALEDNIGFGQAVNLAAEHANGEFLLLLNPDTVVHAGMVEELVGFARRLPEPAICGGRTLRPDGRLDPGSCWGAPTLWSLFCFATMLSTAFKGSRLFDPESLGGWKRDSVRDVDIVTGCLLLAPRLLWLELGGFDPRFFMYGEDADLSLRAAGAGVRRVITPDAVVTHEVGVSSESRPDKVLLLFRGKATLLRKHWGPVRSRIGVALLVSGVGLRTLEALVPGRGRAAGRRRASAWPAVWRARSDWVRGYTEPSSTQPARPPVQTERVSP